MKNHTSSARQSVNEEHAAVLDEVVAIAVAGIAALKVLAHILPESAKSVEATALALSDDFKSLAENAREQGSLADTLIEKAGTLEADGQRMPITAFADLLNNTLKDLTEISIAAYKKAEAAIAALHAAKSLLDSPHLSAPMLEKYLDSAEAHLQNIASSDESLNRKAAEKLSRFVNVIMNQHTMLTQTMQRSSNYSRKIAEATSSLITNMQFQDRNYQIIQNAVAIIDQHMNALKAVQQKAQKSYESQGLEHVEKIISVINLAEIRQKYTEELIKTGIVKKGMDLSTAPDGRKSNEDNAELF